jgi:hypothetical protein
LLVRLPLDLSRFLAVARTPIGDFVPLRTAPSFTSLVSLAT